MIASLREIARALGGEVVGGQALVPGPGHGKRDRSLSVKLSATSPLGFVCYSHAGNTWQDCQAYVASALGLEPDAWRDTRPKAQPVRRRLPAPANPEIGPSVSDELDGGDAARIAAAVALWRGGVDPRGTQVDRYLASRGLELDDNDDVAGAVLRWAPTIGAMVALFRSIETGRPQAVSRTYLDADAHKVERKFLGPVGGAAVMLDPFDSVTTGVHIGEGVEMCMAARQLGLKPTWALGSCGAVAAFPVLDGVEALTILAEHDEASARAVESCAARWHAAGREVLINRPVGGKDLNDCLRGAA